MAINNNESAIIFKGTSEYEHMNPIQTLLKDCIELIHKRMGTFYLKEARQCDIHPIDLLARVVANVFGNICFKIIIMNPNNSTDRLNEFKSVLSLLEEMSMELFTSLEAYYNSDESSVN